MSKKIFLTVFLSLLLSVNFVLGQDKVLIGLGGGGSKPTGDGSEYWNMGFNIHGEIFADITKDMSLGYRAAYNNWSVNSNKFRYDVSATTSIWELCPSIRFLPSSHKEQQTYCFGQIGAGLYIINVDVDLPYYPSEYITDCRFGINFGMGIMVDSRVLIFPMYNIIFTEQKTTNYFTLNLGITFNSHTQW